LETELSPEDIEPWIREIGPKPHGMGFPTKEVLDRVIDAASNLLFIENIDDLLDELAKTLREIFPIKSMIIWISENDGDLNIRKPKIILGFTDEEKSKLQTISYTGMEIDRAREFANKIGRLSYFVPAELYTRLGPYDERDLCFGIDEKSASTPRKAPDMWHPLDHVNISFVSQGGEYIGSIEIEEPSDGKIPSLESIKAIEIFASLASVAIEQAELNEKEQAITEAAEKRSARISRILSFVREMLAIKNPERMMNNILTILSDLFGFKAASIILFDERENCFKYIALMGYSQEEVNISKSLRLPKDSMRFDISPDYLVAHDAYFIPGEKLPDEWLRYEIQTSDGIDRLYKLREQPRAHPRAWHPLDNLIYLFRDRKGRILGMMYPDNPSDGLIPSPETIESIGIYASLVSIAMENTKNYMETLGAKEEIELLNRLLFIDVRNQNAIMRRYLEMSIAEGIDKDRQKKYLKNTLNQMENIVDLIQKVRRLSSIRSRDKSSLLRVDLINSLNNQIPISISRYPKKKVKIEHGAMPDNCYIFANDLIGDMFDHLISNSIEHNPREEVEIWFSIEPMHDEFTNRDFWIFSIKDNGTGIPDDRKKDLLDITSQISRLGEKTGLGLSIVSALVHLYGGSISIDDRIAGDHTKGTVIKIILPAA